MKHTPEEIEKAVREVEVALSIAQVPPDVLADCAVAFLIRALMEAVLRGKDASETLRAFVDKYKDAVRAEIVTVPGKRCAPPPPSPN